MSDSRRPAGSGPGWGADAEPPQYVDPAYAGQLPMYGGYPPPGGPPPYWMPGRPPAQPPGPPPVGGPGPGGGGGDRSPGPRRPPGWAFLVAGGAVLLVVALVIALMIVNGPTDESATPSGPPTNPSMTLAPPRVPASPTPIPPRSPVPSITLPPPPPPINPPTTSPVPGGAAQTIVYSVTGEGRAISIAYLDTGGVLRTEFDVPLPWSKQVTLSPPASTVASVTVVSLGERVGCSITVDGAQVREQTGMVMALCTTVG